MTAVSMTYIFMAREGFQLDHDIAYIVGASAAVILFIVYLIALIRRNKTTRSKL